MRLKRRSIFAAVFVLSFAVSGCGANQERPVLRIGEHDIYREEYDLYCGIVKKDMIDRDDEEQVKELGALYAAECYSLFEIASECGAKEMFSFESFLDDLNEKNEENKDKLSEGDVVMGLIEFEMDDYFEYILADYRQETADRLSASPDEDMVESAEIYYEEHKESYIENARYQYQVTVETEDGTETEVMETDYLTITQSYHASDMLGDVLLSGNIGEEYDLGDRTVVLLDRENSYYSFEEAQGIVIRNYVEDVYLPQEIEKRAGQMDRQFYQVSGG